MIHLTPDETAFLTSLYRGTNGYIKVMGSADRDVYPDKTRNSTFVTNSSFKKTTVSNTVNMRGFTRNNLYLSTSTFQDNTSATVDNIATVQCLCVDIDYKGKYQDHTPEYVLPILYDKMYQSFCNSKFIPYPTYVETSRHLRFIYVLKEPVCLRIDNSKKRKSTVVWLNKILRSLATAINALDPDFNAEVQALTKFIRCPGSVNKRFINPKRSYNKKTHKFDIFTCDEALCYDVHIKKCTYASNPYSKTVYDIHELSDMILPKLGDWYVAGKKSKKKSGEDTATLMKARIKRITALLSTDCIGRREKMIFHLSNCLITLGMNPSDVQKQAEKFNQKFEIPLKSYELRSAVTTKIYKFKEPVFAADLNIEPLYLSTSKKEYDRKRYLDKKKEQVESGTTRTQKLNQKIMEAKKLKEEGMTLSVIAERLDVSISSVKNYLKQDIKDIEQEVKDLEKKPVNQCTSASSQKKEHSLFAVSPDAIIPFDEINETKMLFKIAKNQILKWLTAKWDDIFTYHWDAYCKDAVDDYETAITKTSMNPLSAICMSPG